MVGGLQWQSTIIYRREIYNGVVPSNYEKNIQGFGLLWGGKVRLFKNLYCSAIPSLRYDHLYFDFATNKQVKKFILDIHTGIEYRKNRSGYGIGYNIHNTNKKFSYENPKGTPYHVDMQFWSLCIYHNYKLIDNLFVETKIMQSQSDIATVRFINKKFIFLNIRLYYNLLK